MIGNCVVDASVGIKLFVVEEGSDAAYALFRELTTDSPSRIYVPDLFYVECANILWKYTWRFGYPAVNARQGIVDLLDLRLHSVPTADLLRPALDLAIEHGISVYDACYVALAQRLELPLITADTSLARKLGGDDIIVRTLS